MSSPTRKPHKRPGQQGVALGKTIQTAKVGSCKAKSTDIPLERLYREFARGFDYFWNKRGGFPYASRFQ